ncbi:Type IV secretion system protein virB10 [Aliarcobacter thereius]|uniref:TrbI/VirB10 family protein n=1 Tax=Aliarcobacter thereius TaxID=544718 RepID=UPI000828461C|nr:TrbI/VirB10 family protein [Aliarcobacter thereius]OCL86008.1 Type IV secretion system protein virB10 [Aliarcobacter thereius]
MIKKNKKILIILGIVFLAFSVFISSIVFFSEKKKEEVRVITKAKLPEGYFDPREIIIKEKELLEKEEIEKQQLEEQKQQEIIKEQEAKKQIENKTKSNFDIISKLAQREDVDLSELIRNKINYERLKSVKNSNLAESQKQIKNDNSSNNKEEIKDKFLYDKDFGLQSDVASRVVKLDRVITADKLFPATLMTAISSLLPGKIVAIIEDNIYGSHGKELLIPKGSTAIGSYKPVEKIDEERLAISWQRIITPLGVNINLTNATATDQMGRSGAFGEIDRRYLQRYGLPLAITTTSSLLGYLAMKGQETLIPGNYDPSTIFKNEIIRDYKNDIGKMSEQVLKEQLKIKPVINIEAGTRIFISPVVDIWFPEIRKKEKEVDVEVYEEAKKENEK